jgi:hypothetical protein
MGEAIAPDCHKAFSLALEGAVKQLRRRKRVLHDAKPGAQQAAVPTYLGGNPPGPVVGPYP